MTRRLYFWACLFFAIELGDSSEGVGEVDDGALDAIVGEDYRMGRSKVCPGVHGKVIENHATETDVLRDNDKPGRPCHTDRIDLRPLLIGTEADGGSDVRLLG